MVYPNFILKENQNSYHEIIIDKMCAAQRSGALRRAAGGGGCWCVNLLGLREKMRRNLPETYELLICFHFWQGEPVYAVRFHILM